MKTASEMTQVVSGGIKGSWQSLTLIINFVLVP